MSKHLSSFHIQKVVRMVCMQQLHHTMHNSENERAKVGKTFWGICHLVCTTDSMWTEAELTKDTNVDATKCDLHRPDLLLSEMRVPQKKCCNMRKRCHEHCHLPAERCDRVNAGDNKVTINSSVSSCATYCKYSKLLWRRPSLLLSGPELLHRLRRWDAQHALVLYSSLLYKGEAKNTHTLWASPPLCSSSFSSSSSSYSSPASKNCF